MSSYEFVELLGLASYRNFLINVHWSRDNKVSIRSSQIRNVLFSKSLFFAYILNETPCKIVFSFIKNALLVVQYLISYFELSHDHVTIAQRPATCLYRNCDLRSKFKVMEFNKNGFYAIICVRIYTRINGKIPTHTSCWLTITGHATCLSLKAEKKII